MTADEWKAHVGRKVVFTYHHGEREEGVVTSANDKYVFVRFGNAVRGVACDPEQVELSVPGA